MTISTDLDLWWAEHQNYTESNAAKARFQDIMGEIDNRLTELQTMYANGDFDKLPATVKSEFISAWTQLDTVRQALKNDAGFMEALAWRP